MQPISTTSTLDAPKSAYITPRSSTTILESDLSGAVPIPVTPATQIQKSSAYVPTMVTSTLSHSSGTPSSPPEKGGEGSNKNNESLPRTLDDQDGRRIVYGVWDAGQTFLGTYLTILVAVLYRMLWTTVYNDFNSIEPFRQLMQPSGVLAEYAFFSFYQSQSNLLGPLPALLKRRWALALVATAYSLACLLPALASESIFVDTDSKCSNIDLENSNNPCWPRMTANVHVLRVLQGLLTLAAAVTLFITSSLLFRKTGLPSSPRALATLGSLMRHPGLIQDLNHVPVNATSKDMKRVLQGKRYQLGYYKGPSGEDSYGIRPTTEDDYVTSSFLNHNYTPIDGSLPLSDRQSSPPSRFRITDFVLCLFVLGAFAVVLAYYLDHKNDGFNGFFNSDTFGTRFVLTLAATVIATLWKSVEQSVYCHVCTLIHTC